MEGWLLWWLRGSAVMVASARHPGCEPLNCCFFFAFLLSLQQVDFQLIALHTYTIHVNQTKN